MRNIDNKRKRESPDPEWTDKKKPKVHDAANDENEAEDIGDTDLTVIQEGQDDEKSSGDDETDWEVVDEDGDCMFCYHCLDAKGLSYCDNEDCQMAIHLDCCKQLDKAHNVKTTLVPNSSIE